MQQAIQQNEHVHLKWEESGRCFALTFVGVAASDYVSIFARDLSDDQRQEYRDPLTGLANRTLFLDRLRQVVSLALRNDNYAAVHVIRLQHFKNFSARLEYGEADTYLHKVAERLTGIVRVSDTVARIGLDEFAIIQVEPEGYEDIEAMASKIQQAMEKPVIISEEKFLCKSRTGISVSPVDAETSDELLRNAFLALDEKFKKSSKNYRFFKVPMLTARNRQEVLEKDLENAIGDEQFTLYFQPKQDLESGQIRGMETLVRWNHPEHGILLPDEFISIAERTKLILPLGAWILSSACQNTKRFNELGLGPLKVAVNLSALQFNDKNIVDAVRDVLNETGLAPEFLELEITETVAMNDAIAANQTFQKITDLGVSLTIDDFGTGFSSLAYLKKFKVQGVKIDKVFVDDIGSGSDEGAIARAIATMGHSFGMSVTAEGVTNKEQVAFLRRLDCDDIQGDYLSPALNRTDFEDFLRAYEAPDYLKQGLLNWSEGRDTSNAAFGSALPNKRRSVKDQRNLKS